MTREEYLLTCLMEECGEVIQAASKVLRFGKANKAEGAALDNAHQLALELSDVRTIALELERVSDIPVAFFDTGEYFDAKLARIERFRSTS